jgi:hypothetical protein
VHITAYKTSLTARRVSVFVRKNANEKLKELLASALNLVADQIDRMMFLFKKSKPHFYGSYLNTCKVVDNGIRYEKPEVSEATV